MGRNRRRFGILLGLGLALGAAQPGSGRGRGVEAAPDGEVVVYSALDREFAEPVLRAYEARTGVDVLGKYDVESTKTVGLTNLLIAESDRPRCDVFWNNEILNTIRLKEKGLLTPFRPVNADKVPATFRDKEGTWYGFAARARVLLVNTKLVPEASRPRSIRDLTDPRWRGKIGIAKPLFGTTATHAACLFVAWGERPAKQYFLDLKANDAKILSGNKGVARDVGSGRLAFGLTDTDDAMAEIDEGSPVAIVYPDRGEGELGTLFLPNTLAIPRGAPHPDRARALIDHLLSREVEAALAIGPGAQIPLLNDAEVKARVETPRTVHPMDVDFAKAARIWDGVAAFLAAEFGG